MLGVMVLVKSNSRKHSPIGEKLYERGMVASLQDKGLAKHEEKWDQERTKKAWKSNVLSDLNQYESASFPLRFE